MAFLWLISLMVAFAFGFAFAQEYDIIRRK